MTCVPQLSVVTLYAAMNKSILKKLKLEHKGTNASFLNLDINLVNGNFVYKLQDERDSYPVFTETLVSKTIRIAISALYFCDILQKVRELVSRKLRRDGKVIKCNLYLKKIINIYQTTLIILLKTLYY